MKGRSLPGKDSDRSTGAGWQRCPESGLGVNHPLYASPLVFKMLMALVVS
jgi:hypothetical protein